MKRPRTNAVTVSLHLLDHGDVDCSVAISGRYIPAKTYGPPERCAPAEWPDADLLSATNEDGDDVLPLLSDRDVQTVFDRALEDAAEREADAEDAAADDAADARRELARERDY